MKRRAAKIIAGVLTLLFSGAISPSSAYHDAYHDERL